MKTLMKIFPPQYYFKILKVKEKTQNKYVAETHK